MKTIKQIEKEHTNCFAIGYNCCREDVVKLIEPLKKAIRKAWIINGGSNNFLIVSQIIDKELKARITGE